MATLVDPDKMVVFRCPIAYKTNRVGLPVPWGAAGGAGGVSNPVGVLPSHLGYSFCHRGKTVFFFYQW